MQFATAITTMFNVYSNDSHSCSSILIASLNEPKKHNRFAVAQLLNPTKKGFGLVNQLTMQSP
jgi:hypothetical protein